MRFGGRRHAGSHQAKKHEGLQRDTIQHAETHRLISLLRHRSALVVASLSTVRSPVHEIALGPFIYAYGYGYGGSEPCPEWPGPKTASPCGKLWYRWTTRSQS